MRLDELLKHIETIAPRDLAEDWDNSGVQINCGDKEIRKVLTCLDVSWEVVSEAHALGADLIVSHHPLIFEPMKSIDDQNPNHKKIIALIQAGISVYSAHMTYDKSANGNTVMLAQRLGISGIPLPDKRIGETLDYSVLTANLHPSMELGDLCRLTSERLDVPTHELRLVQGGDAPIEKIALCAGSGGDFLTDIIQEGCTAFITGDVKYHTALAALDAGVSLIDAGHFFTEKHFASDFARCLSLLIGDALEIHISNANHNPFATL